jgi:predicted amidohydrolase
MLPPPPPPRIAIAQIAMHWELDANLAAMRAALVHARTAGARVCAFSELAVTGFHRRIVEWAQPALIEAALADLQADAAALGIAAVFGAPTFDAAGRRFNSHLFVDAGGRLVGAVAKNGLTAPEATFFEAGSERPVLALDGLACSAVICREIEDHAAVVAQLAGRPLDLVFWPGQMRPDPALPPADPPRHVQQAMALARALGCCVVQTNWPNALNRPEESAGTGASVCVSPAGELLFRLPEQGRGIGVFELGAPAFEWLGEEAVPSAPAAAAS